MAASDAFAGRLTNALAFANQVLRGQLNTGSPAAFGRLPLKLLGCVGICGLGYGTVMGSFGGIGTEHTWQMLYSAAKVPLLLLGTFVLCLPSFFVFNTVAGLRQDFREAAGALISAQAGMTIVLCALAPFTAVWYLSVSNYSAAVLFNGLVFGGASLTTTAILRRNYRRLIERNSRHRLLLRTWSVLYIFVGIQLGWVLRPFVGHPGTAVQWFRPDAWGNAYLAVLHHMSGLISP
ncbi:MAG: hypothetical protein U1G07_12760 [Verrucomicrobiota bacterium]